MTTPAKILIVEDDRDSLKMMATLLQSWGYEVNTALTAEAALDSISEVCPAVVISDLIMPGMNGLELLHAIREERKECEIFFILATGYATGPRAVDAIVKGADEVLLKPIDPGELLDKLQQHGFHGART